MPKIKGENVSCKELFFGKQFRRWAFYLLLFFLIMMTVIEVTQLVIEYAGCPKEANMNINFNESIVFPNMTFCMSRDQAWSHFKIDNSKIDNNPEWDKEIQLALTNMTSKDEFLKSNWPTSMVVRAYQAIGTLNSLERESTSQSARKDITSFAHGKKFGGVRKLVKDWLDIIDERNVTFTDFQQKVGVEALKRSLREMTRIWRLDEDEEETRTSVRITWVSLLSLCFQPAPKNGTFKDIEEQVGDFTIDMKEISFLI
ncbi:Amiloride-sensitive sodium channel [Ditylenchus destructor]|nr:Amiloride-sensitive sodium channel [Ditylenchus destructor]